TEEMVASMAPGSVIVDISIDQGGNCAVTVPGEKALVHNVVIEGIKNIPGMLPTSSTWMFAHNMYHLVEYLTHKGEIRIKEKDEIVSGILTTIRGKLVHQGALDAMKEQRG
ncbi:MAG TPA: NAD(P)(+) transhydrogenase (Re/Si-specific) subunit alpha, partial [Clostridiales bacterium]|nr:NAD(P)(+) transhydrogenase (Re/Si-specific) subunit alpha [Clostridiales bacterium]